MGHDELLRRFYDEVWVKGNVDAIDEFVAVDYIDHTDPPASGTAREHLKMVASTFRDTCSSRALRVDKLMSIGDQAAVYWTMTWTQHGDFFGYPADGRQLMLQGAHFFLMRDQKMAEVWHA